MDTPRYNRAVKLLESDIPKHLVTLKYLALYKKDAAVEIDGDGKRWAVLSSFPTSILSFDREAYPRAEVALFVNGTDDALKHRLLNELPINNYVLRLNEPLDLSGLDRYSVSRGYTYNSYTCQKLSQTAPGIVLLPNSRLTEDAIKFFALNNHDEPDLIKYFKKGAKWFGIIKDNEIKSACFIYEDYANVREIGGMRTLEHERRKGYARVVTYSALKYLLDNRLTPRICTEEKNVNSIRVVQSLDMNQFLRIEHFLLNPK
jgi:hypothetical protein